MRRWTHQEVAPASEVAVPRRVASARVRPRVLGVPATASSSLTRMGTPARGVRGEKEIGEVVVVEVEGAMGKMVQSAWTDGGDRRAESLRVTAAGFVVCAV